MSVFVLTLSDVLAIGFAVVMVAWLVLAMAQDYWRRRRQ
jgi:hypothetical protein